MALAILGVDSLDTIVAAAGFWPQPANGSTGPTCVYYDRYDRFYSGRTSTYSGGANAGPGWFDPYFLDGTVPSCQRFLASPNYTNLSVGEWDRVNNTQNLYGRTLSTVIEAIDPTSMLSLGQVYPNLGWTSTQNGKVSANDGYYGTTNSNRWIFFESLGYALVFGNTQVRFGGTLYAALVVQVDLATGDGIPLVGAFPCRFQASPSTYQRAEAFGDTFTMDDCQFVHDDDSTPGRPKGLMIQSVCANRIATGDAVRDYVRFSEWNPTDKAAAAGTANRTHLRERFVSRLEYLDGATGAYPTGLGGGVEQAHTYMTFYHPPTRTLSIVKGVVGGAHVANRTTLRGRFRTAPAVTQLTVPAPSRDVETLSIVPFVSVAVGSLGERIAGVEVAFTLQAGSSFEEVLTTGAPASSSTPAHQMDDDPAFQPIVKKNGTALTVTTHYTLNFGTNAIQFVGPEPVAATTYTVTYRHRTAPVSPSHGSLLNAAALTDLDGLAIARVRYPDDADLVGMIDVLTASSA